MKKMMFGLFALFSFNALADEVTIVKCSVKVKNKEETMKIKVDKKGVLGFWSDDKIVQASKKSYFSNLSNLESFGLEGSHTYFTANGYSALSVNNTAEAIDIGVHKDFSKGFYNYRDGGSGIGNLRMALKCKIVK